MLPCESGRFHAPGATPMAALLMSALQMAALLSVPACGRPAAASAASATQQAYPKASEEILNPERGLYVPNDAISRDNLKDVRGVRKSSVIRTLYSLDAYRNAALPSAFLQKVGADLGLVRAAGLKAIVRFVYSYDIGQPDAPLDRVLAHIGQLAPVLAADADVIAMLEAGFIGAWGEWHSSTNGLDNDAGRKAVLLKLLSALPAERMVVVRCNFYKRAAFGSDLPLDPVAAFGGSPRARVGAHNDCLGASADDFGTYTGSAIEKEKSFLNLDNRYVPQEGETCNPGTYAQCAAMLKDLPRMRWDLLNQGYHTGVLDGWKQEGCFAEIQKRLGYRFVLLRSILQDSVRPGGGLQVSLTLANEGWGKAFNPRGLELVLREEKTKARYVLPLAYDPRRWGAGDSITLDLTGGVPAGMPPGKDALYLNLPDPAPRLRKRPEYSIRLANAGLWEDSTGLNSLRHSVIVSPAAGGAPSPIAFFAPENAGGTVALRAPRRSPSRPQAALRGQAFDLCGRSLPRESRPE